MGKTAKQIAIITDSTCDLPADWIEQYAITVIPLTVIFGEEQYLDGIQISALEFYERLLIDPVHPTTSQPAPEVFQEAYKTAITAGAEEIVVMVISSAMSGTCDAALQAAQQIVHRVNHRGHFHGHSAVVQR